MLNTARREIYRKRVTSVRSISVVRTKSPLISRTNRRLYARPVLHLDARISPLLLRNARQVCGKYVHQVPRREAMHATLPCIATKHGRGKQGGLLIHRPCVYKERNRNSPPPPPPSKFFSRFTRRGYGNSCFQVRVLHSNTAEKSKRKREREREK